METGVVLPARRSAGRKPRWKILVESERAVRLGRFHCTVTHRPAPLVQVKVDVAVVLPAPVPSMMPVAGAQIRNHGASSSRIVNRAVSAGAHLAAGGMRRNRNTVSYAPSRDFAAGPG